MKKRSLNATPLLTLLILPPLGALQAAEPTATPDIDPKTMDQWSAPYRGWLYLPEHVSPAHPNIPGYAQFHDTDVRCVYQLPSQPDLWYMSFIAFDGQGYNSFVAETPPRVALGRGGRGRGRRWHRP